LAHVLYHFEWVRKLDIIIIFLLNFLLEVPELCEPG
jgi:hypothetical protein